MSKEIKSTELGTDLYAENEKFFDGTAIVTAATFTSSAVRFHQTLGGVEAKVIASADFTIADTETVTVNVLTSSTIDGTFVQSAVIGLTTASGATAITAGDVLGSYIKPAEITGEYYAKFTVVPSAAMTGAAVDGYIVEV
jgi:hypothetical protein